MLQFKEALYDGWSDNPVLHDLLDAVKIAIENNDLDHSKHLMISFMENSKDKDLTAIVDYIYAMLPENIHTIETEIVL